MPDQGLWGFALPSLGGWPRATGHPVGHDRIINGLMSVFGHEAVSLHSLEGEAYSTVKLSRVESLSLFFYLIVN